MNFRATSAGLVGIILCLCVLPTSEAAETRSPEETVEAFHQGLHTGDAALVLSLLTPDVIVYEMGLIDSSRNAYAISHLSADMQAAGEYSQELMSRRSGGSGNERWVVSTYRLLMQGDKSLLLETMYLRRIGGSWRIFHIHWSSRLE